MSSMFSDEVLEPTVTEPKVTEPKVTEPKVTGGSHCLCGCGETPINPSSQWIRGHHHRGVGGYSGPSIKPKSPPRKGPKPPTRRAKAREAGAERGKQIDRVVGLIGAFQLPATLMVLVGKQTGSKALVADGVVTSSAAPGLSKALVDLAEDNAVLDRAIDAVLTAGPYAELVGILIPMGLQLAANHELAPVVPQLGTASVDDVLRAAGLGVDDGEA